MSNPIILSEEQKLVVQSTDPRLNVVASAGAGKTSVLVESYLRHVQEGFRPDEILTITFTKKAAAEMKERIVKRLRQMERFADAQMAETGPIQTIHSFCERLLRENSLEAGLDPQFVILSESQLTRLVSQCVREVLASPLDEAPGAEALLSFLAGRSTYADNRSRYGLLEHSIQEVMQELRGSGKNQLQIQQWHLSPEILRQKWEETVLDSFSEEVQQSYHQRSETDFQARLIATLKDVGTRPPSWLRKPLEEGSDEEALYHSCALVQLACAAWWRLDREMDRQQCLDFTALEERGVRLLTRSEVTRQRLRDQYGVVMIDEAQDLNPIQYSLIDAISPRSLMMVGDHQQSIYGFRQADVRLFRDRVAQAGHERLTRNYRSTPGILRFVDYVFGALWSDAYAPMGEIEPIDLPHPNVARNFEGVEFWRQELNDHASVAQNIAELHEEGTPYKEITVLVADARRAREIEMVLAEKGIPSRIAGGSERFYTRLEVRDLANALRAVADPTDDFSLLACLRSPVVGLTLDSIVLLGAQTPVAENLAEFAPPVPDDITRLADFLSWYEPLRQYADRLSAWEVLAEIFAKSQLLPTLARRPDADRLLANVRKLLTLATKEPENGPLEYAERIREIQDLRHKEGDAPADESDADLVTIMTVHKAKGLEFPVVVLPHTDRKLGQRARDLIVDQRLGLVATKFGKTQGLMHRFLSERAGEREYEEQLRVLYVALTRAKSRLCVCLYPYKDRERTASNLLARILGDEIPFGVRERVAGRSNPPGL